jgi:thioredoxin 2
MATVAATTKIRCPHCGKLNRVAVAAEGVPRCGNCHNALPWVVDASGEIFDAAIRSSLLVLVDFWAEWCGPCHMVSPVLERLANEYAGRLKLVKLNTENAPAVAARYGVQSIPLLVLIRDGQEIDRLVGAAPERRLRDWIEPHLGPAPSPPASSGAQTAGQAGSAGS